ncbi:hypothetical protein [Sediminicola luteus]|uniref:Uncharacterized protein n=1 Tax=Sediminicola luteus TaxID=319238 RepID=A0A2A4GAZ4_9FLAO|nr:hypothetical protein [Sediminicola luteus]PCE64922.1 hypothetical protein B7P33_07095 [Sediminicola luteus]
MKAIITIIIVLLLGFTAQAQDQKATTLELPVQTVVLDVEITTPAVEHIETEEKTIEVARLHKFRTSRVKKALSFKTKKNRKMLA